MDRDRIIIIGTEIGPIVEIEVNLIIEEEETLTIIEVIGPTIELEVSIEMVMGMEMATVGMIDMTVDQIIGDNYRQDHGNQRYRNRNPSQDHGRSRPRYRSNSIDNFKAHSYHRSQSRNRNRSSSRDEGQRSRTVSRDRNIENGSTTRSRSSSCVTTDRDRLRCFRCSEYDHFARECPNTLTDEESGSGSEDLDDSTWQMLSQYGVSALQDFHMEDLNM